MEFVEEEGGRRWRPPQPRVDCRYLVTAWTSEVRDEHRLLGDAARDAADDPRDRGRAPPGRVRAGPAAPDREGRRSPRTTEARTCGRPSAAS